MDGTISSSSLPARSAVDTLSAGQVADLLGGLLAALGQLAHLGGHHREALAVLAGARRLDGGVQRQQVGLVGDVVDDADLLRDLLHRLTVCVTASPPSPASLAGLGGHAVGDLGVVAVLRDRRRHHVDRRGGLFHRAACSLAACDRLCAVALTWLAAPVSASARRAPPR
jgi:hypothetical protein